MIAAAEFPRELAIVRELFREYAAAIGVDLYFQQFDAELAGLPGKYAPPTGRLLVAWRDANPIGCVAMRRIDDRSCEMKRLYVRSRARGERLGHRLAERICDEARAAGYARICLDTLPTMIEAQRLYARLGFQPIAPYVFNPIEGARYLALAL